MHDWSIVDLQVVDLVVANLVLMTGACLQGVIGYGLTLFSAPVLFLINPVYVPTALLIDALFLNVIILLRERAACQWHLVRWAALGNLLGAALAGIVIAQISAAQFQLAFGILILLAVAISVFGYQLPLNAAAGTAAGFASGFMGTCTSVGGPPMGLLYQSLPPAQIRGNLAAVFLIAGIASLLALFFAQRLTMRDMQLALFCLPGMLLGVMVSGWFKRWLPDRLVRPLILTVSGVAGLGLLLQAGHVGQVLK